jgi:hypothetical protein
MKAIGMVLALVVGAAMSFAQDAKKDDCCGAKGILCPKDGRCEAKCREICDRVGATMKAVRARVGEIMQKEVGAKCECSSGDCCADHCGTCDAVKSKVFVPIMKEKVTARFKEIKKDVLHKVKGDDGKESEVKCTFLTGDTCKSCVEDQAQVAWTKLKEMFSAKK